VVRSGQCQSSVDGVCDLRGRAPAAPCRYQPVWIVDRYHMCLIRPPGRAGLALAGLGRVWHRSLSAACTLYTSLSLGPTQGHAVPLFGVVEVGLHEIAELQPAVDWNVW